MQFIPLLTKKKLLTMYIKKLVLIHKLTLSTKVNHKVSIECKMGHSTFLTNEEEIKIVN